VGERRQQLIKADDAPWQTPKSFLSALPARGLRALRARGAGPGGKRAVDLSADFRLSPDAVYGLTEFTRPRLADAELVANPGCYPTAALLAAGPPLASSTHRSRAGNHHRRRVGVTGAGRNPQA